MKKLYILFLVLAFNLSANAQYVIVKKASAEAGYFIDPVSGNDANDGSIGFPWETITKANNTLVAGETVYLRGGTYDAGVTGNIIPDNSGTPGNLITYSAYQSEIPKIIQSNDLDGISIDLTDRSYIKIIGIYVDGEGLWNASDVEQWVLMHNTSYSIIEACNFKYAEGWSGMELRGDAKYNHIKDNTFEFCGTWDDGAGNDRGDAVGFEECQYNLFEGNTIKKAGHSLFYCTGKYNLMRNNIFDGDWTDLENSDSGVRAIEQSDGGDGYHDPRDSLWKMSKFNIYEDNLIINTGVATDNATNPGNKLQGYGNVFRFNIFSTNRSPGHFIQTNVNSTTPFSSENRTFHNTFWNNGGGGQEYQDLSSSVQCDNNFLFNNIYYDLNKNPEDGTGSSKDVIVRNNLNGPSDPVAPANNKIQNNVFYNPNHGIESKAFIFFKDVGNKEDVAHWETNQPTVVSGNFGDNDPLISDTINFTLEVGSPAIDAGKEITEANGSGSSQTIITVDDPYSFFAGIPYFSVDGDEIIINGNTVNITAIDYNNKQITISSPITWSDNDNIYLSRTGTSPNIGVSQ